MTIQRKCEHCEENLANHTRFGVWLCPSCKAAFEELEQTRLQEERDKIAELVNESKKPWEPSLAYALYGKRLSQAIDPKISIDKQEDYFNACEVPLIHLLADEEIKRIFEIEKMRYFYLQAALGMRKTDRFREAQVIKKQTKVVKIREKSEKEIEKQKKHASKDKSLSKEERGRAKVLEGLMSMGMSEADAKKMMEMK